MTLTVRAGPKNLTFQHAKQRLAHADHPPHTTQALPYAIDSDRQTYAPSIQTP